MKRLLILTLLLVTALPAMAFGATEPLKTALVIGNANYPSSPLANPVNDASDMRDKLTKLGFDVIYRENAGLRDMDEAVREFGSKLKRGGAGVFYYAGHAMQIGGQNFLIPVDAKLRDEIDVRYETLDVGYVLDTLYSAENDLNIVILDACRDNPFQRSFRSASRGLARMDAPTGTLIAYATSPGKTALDGDGRNGVYTKHLLEHIDSPGEPMEQMFKQVRIGVAQETENQQIPWESSSVMGNFSFNPAAAEPEQVANVQPQSQMEPSDYELEKQKLEQVKAELQAAYEEEKRRLEEMNALLKEKAAIAELQAEKERVEKQRILAEKEAALVKQQEQSHKQIQTMEAEKAKLEEPPAASVATEPVPVKKAVVEPAPASKPAAATTSKSQKPTSQKELAEDEARQKLAMLKQQPTTPVATTQPAKKTAAVTKPKPVEVEVKKERSIGATVSISSNISNAEVYIAQGEEQVLGFLPKTKWVLLGKTPLTRGGIDPGEQRFRIVKHGYEEVTVSKTLSADKTTDFSVRLKKEASFIDGNFGVY